MSRRPPRPRPVTVHNSTGYTRVYDTAGRVIEAGGRREANATDPLTAALIRERTLIILEENK